MIEYLKTKKDYFYKLKNGEKKRISQKEYNKKNKTIKKMIGAGKTKDEIIAELKTKGKYDEWVSLGSRFGLIRNVLRGSYFSPSNLRITNPYMYYDVDGKIVNVSAIESQYESNANNIAVFKQHRVIDPTHVTQSTYKIANWPNILSTSGLATCTGLAMVIGNQKLMAHLDATTFIPRIIIAIRAIIAEEKIKARKLMPIIYAGALDSDVTVQKAKDICSQLGIPEENYTITHVCITDRVTI